VRHWPLRSVINMQMLKETRQRLVINSYYYTQLFNKIKNTTNQLYSSILTVKTQHVRLVLAIIAFVTLLLF
jgi:hypothetical protein